MTRPLTCLTLVAAAGAGLYLYQEKHQAQLLDREINRVIHATEQTRERTGMMKAEWALLNEPDRLAGLAAQHLSLQAVAPAQFAQLADLGSRLPPVGAPPAPIALAAMEEPAPALAPAVLAPPVLAPAPVVAAPRAAPRPGPVQGAQAAAHQTMSPPARPLMPPVVQAAPAPMLQHPSTPMMAQANIPARAAQPMQVAAHLPEPAHNGYAPFASGYAAPPMRAPTVQQAAAGLPAAPYAGAASYAGATPYAGAAPYIGSALGMSRTGLPAPVPVAVGSLPGR